MPTPPLSPSKLNCKIPNKTFINSNKKQNTPETSKWFSLPDDIKIYTADRFLNLNQLFQISRTCTASYELFIRGKGFQPYLWIKKIYAAYKIKITLPKIDRLEDKVAYVENIFKEIPQTANTFYELCDLRFLINEKNYTFKQAKIFLEDFYQQGNYAGLMAAKFPELDDELPILEGDTAETQNLSPEFIKKMEALTATNEKLCLRYFILCEGKSQAEAELEYSNLGNGSVPDLIRVNIAKGLMLSEARKFVDQIQNSPNFHGSFIPFMELLVKYCQFKYPEGFLEVKNFANMQRLPDECQNNMLILVEKGYTPKAAFELIKKLPAVLIGYIEKGLTLAEVEILFAKFKNNDLEYVYDTLLEYGSVEIYGKNALTTTDLSEINWFNQAIYNNITYLVEAGYTPKEAFAAIKLFPKFNNDNLKYLYKTFLEYGKSELYGKNALTTTDLSQIDWFNEARYNNIKYLIKAGNTPKEAFAAIKQLPEALIEYIKKGLTLAQVEILFAKFKNNDLKFAYDTLLEYGNIEIYGENALTATDLYEINLFNEARYNDIKHLVETGYTPKAAITLLQIVILGLPNEENKVKCALSLLEKCRESKFTQADYTIIKDKLKSVSLIYPKVFLTVDDIFNIPLWGNSDTQIKNNLVTAGFSSEEASTILNIFDLAKLNRDADNKTLEVMALSMQWRDLGFKQSHYNVINNNLKEGVPLTVIVTQLRQLCDIQVEGMERGLNLDTVKVLATGLLAPDGTLNSPDILKLKIETLLTYGDVKKYGNGALTAEALVNMKNGDFEVSYQVMKLFISKKNYTPIQALKQVEDSDVMELYELLDKLSAQTNSNKPSDPIKRKHEGS